MISGIDNYVYLKKDTHEYFDRDGRKYESVSAFRNRFKTPFNAELMSRQVAKSTRESVEDIKDNWENYKNERAEAGTEIHEAIELYLKTTTIEEKNERLRPGLLSIASQYKDYYRVYNETIVYDTEHLIAGTIDTILQTTSHKNSVIDLTDWKTNIKGLPQKELDKHGKPKNKYFLHCLSHLQDSKYNDYSIQLSIYCWLLQRMTNDRKIGQINIHYINPENPLINYILPTVYMKDTVEAMLKWKNENPIPIEPVNKNLNHIKSDWDL